MSLRPTEGFFFSAKRRHHTIAVWSGYSDSLLADIDDGEKIRNCLFGCAGGCVYWDTSAMCLDDRTMRSDAVHIGVPPDRRARQMTRADARLESPGAALRRRSRQLGDNRLVTRRVLRQDTRSRALLKRLRHRNDWDATLQEQHACTHDGWLSSMQLCPGLMLRRANVVAPRLRIRCAYADRPPSRVRSLFAMRPFWFVVAILGGLCAGDAHSQCEYEVTVLKFPISCGLGTARTIASGLNDQAHVVGSYRCPFWKHNEAFLWTLQEGFVTLQRPSQVSSAIAEDINSGGAICGEMVVTGLGFRGFVYEDGLWTELAPAVPVAGALSSAAAISNSGVVVGLRSIHDGLNPLSAFIWSAEEGFTDLGVMNGPSSGALDVNDGGEVVGWTGNGGSTSAAFLWRDGELSLIGPIPVPGGFTSRASGISNNGLVAGTGRVQSKPGAAVAVLGFVLHHGEIILIDPVPGYDTSGVGDVNQVGQVTGLSVKLTNSSDRRGFLWQNGGTHDLNELVPPEAGIMIERAIAINNRGQIVADGNDASGDRVSFLLTPMNVPLGDLDFDCRIGIVDFLLLLAIWGETESPADLDMNGIVGLEDMLILLDKWG